MAVLSLRKVVAALPETLEPSTIYFVRRGQGYDQYITNESGMVVSYVDNLKISFDEHAGAGGEAHALATETEAGFISPEEKVRLLHVPKFWAGRVNAKNGDWSVDYSSAGFTKPPYVSATGHASGSSAGSRNFACVRTNTITATGCAGGYSEANSAGLLAAMVMVSGSGPVDIIAVEMPD